MGRRRNVDIEGGEWAGRTGTIIRMDNSHYYVQVDGGRGVPKSDGTPKPGDAVEVWIPKRDCVRTGGTPRWVKPKYDFTVITYQLGVPVELAQVPCNYPVYEVMDRLGLYALQTLGTDYRTTADYYRDAPIL